MANIEPYSALCSSTDGINVTEIGDVSINDMTTNTSVTGSNLLASVSNGVCTDISSQGAGSLTSTVGGVILNNIEGTHFISQETSQINNSALGAFPSTEFDFHSVNNINESQSSFGSANLFNVPIQVTPVTNSQLYAFEGMKAGVNGPQPIQPKLHAISLNATLGKLQTSLGPSLTPIKLAQQGNVLSSFQSLNQDQLGQLLRIIQQQQHAGHTSNTNNQEILLQDPSGQQKTILKICYSNPPIGMSTPLAHPAQHNAGLNQNVVNGADGSLQQKKHQIDSDVLMRMDKEHKKKHRPRTRSGRVSKPPQYMVKDYKHIHPVDYDEDYDDSDGGYSDFKMSSGDEDNKNNAGDNPLSYASLKSKRFQCGYCEKSYIGKGGLNRHYKLNPTHGKPDDEIGNELGDSFYSSDSVQSGFLASNISNGEMSTIQSKRAADNQTPLALEVFPNGESRQKDLDLTYRGGRRGRRGRPLSLNCDDKRRQKLFEVARNCSDEDILELFIQRCPFTVSLWEILSLKNSKVYDSNVDSLLGEVSNLHDQISSHLSERLVPLSEEDYQNCEGDCDLSNKNLFEMVDEKLATCLNLPIGKYLVKSENGYINAEQKSQIDESVEKSQEKCMSSKIGIVLPPRKRLKMSDMSTDLIKYARDASILGTGKCVTFDIPSDQSATGTFDNTKLTVLDGPDDTLVSSTSQVNFFSMGENSTVPNIASTSFTSNAPDSSLHSAIGISSSALNEIWTDIVKSSAGCPVSDISNGASLDLTNIEASCMKIKEEKKQNDISSIEAESNLLASQQPADSYSNLDASPQEQGVCVTCYPMQECIQVHENARYVQTPDGLVVVKNPDGSYQIYGNLVQNITLEMLEAYFVN